MNIDVSSKVLTTNNISTTNSSKNQVDDSVKFSDELSKISSKDIQEENENDNVKTESTENSKETNNEESLDNIKENEKDSEKIKEHIETKNQEKEINSVIDGLEDVVVEINDKLNKPEKNEENNLINNDINIQEQKDLQMFQMNANMNFNSDGQPFANFMNNQKDQLNSSSKDLEEESAILSTMSENIAMANKNRVLNEREAQNQAKIKTVANSEGVKKVDKKSNVTVETVVKYDNVVMNEEDVDFFTKLIENGQANITQATAKSSKVSKTLADMLAKSMKDNQPIRIDFDNNISVIIKVSRDGKISADFLPSSQIAEAYLKENLPLLRQKFEDNNIEYDELNQRQRKQDEKENQKKEQKDE